MSEPRVWTFFYGSYMNRAVLREADLVLERFEVALLPGYDIRIAPRANLVVSPDDRVYGLLAEVTHTELLRLYSHATDVLGETYHPHPVLVQILEGGWRAALCYISASMVPRAPDPHYVDRIVTPARGFGFPEWYITRLEDAAAG